MVKIVHLSDTHLRPFNPEPGDILVHSGDALNYGNLEELTKFRSQLEAVHKNYKHILFIAGNHDRIFEEAPSLAEEFLLEKIPNLHILNNKSIELEGLKFYGESSQPFFCNWAFNVEDTHKLYDIYAQIPDDVNVLITHCPPKGILDSVYGESVGSIELKAHLPRLKQLKAHLWGHIHYSYGLEQVNGIYYSNAAACNEEYIAVNKENVIELH